MPYADLRRIAFVGDYLPRKCGIATFTHDLRSAVAQFANAECIVVPVDDIAGGYEYPPEVRFQLCEQELDSYRRAADFLNFSNVDVVSLQHEFGIYGGPGGGHILALLRDLRHLSGDRLANQMRDTLTTYLIELFRNSASDGWTWFEDVASYNNAKLPHALILSGRWNGNQYALEIGLRSLRWLADKQQSSKGRFRPIGCNGFCRRGQPAAEYDQQPIEAHATVSAAIEAWNTVDDPFWCEQAHLAFDWFLGRNDLGQPLYDTVTGGCYDGRDYQCTRSCFSRLGTEILLWVLT